VPLMVAAAWVLLVALSKLGWLAAECPPATPTVLLLLVLVHAASMAGSPAASSMLPLRELITCCEALLLYCP
jgi:hypothetical protein